MNLYFLVEASMAIMPVVVFLTALIFLDSFKLVDIRSLLHAIIAGVVAALLALGVNYNLIVWFDIDVRSFVRFLAPVTEETLKYVYLVYLIRTVRVGFMVDAAIFGFAVGTGFAIIENAYYLNALKDPGILTWLVRGFGTAVMHGGSVAIAAIITKDIIDTRNWPEWLKYLPGLAAAIIIHMLYNQFFLPPVTITLIILITLPPVIYLIFKQSEAHTRNWLGEGLDNDLDTLQLIMAGDLSESRVGNYLATLQVKFEGPVMADILGYLRVYLELSIKAKGILIMKESGFTPPPDPEIRSAFVELEFLEKSIGKTGKIALQPLLNLSDQDLWQLHMLQKK